MKFFNNTKTDEIIIKITKVVPKNVIQAEKSFQKRDYLKNVVSLHFQN